MDYKKLFYLESRRKFLNDITNMTCKDSEDSSACISKNLMAFDFVFESLSEQLSLEDKLIKEFKVREKEGANYIKQIPFIEKHTQYVFPEHN